MVKKKNETVKLLQKEIEVKDRLVQNLMVILIENKIAIPEKIWNVVQALYNIDKRFHVIKSDDIN